MNGECASPFGLEPVFSSRRGLRFEPVGPTEYHRATHRKLADPGGFWSNVHMGFEVGDNGRAPRVPLELSVWYGCDPQHTSATGRGTDLSASGVFVHTREPGRVGSMVYLRVALSDGSKLAEGFGRVARVGNDTGGQMGMGIQFINLDDQSISLLEETLARKLGQDHGPI